MVYLSVSARGYEFVTVQLTIIAYLSILRVAKNKEFTCTSGKTVYLGETVVNKSAKLENEYN